MWVCIYIGLTQYIIVTIIRTIIANISSCPAASPAATRPVLAISLRRRPWILELFRLAGCEEETHSRRGGGKSVGFNPWRAVLKNEHRNAVFMRVSLGWCFVLDAQYLRGGRGDTAGVILGADIFI